jgi:hypothetical protein
MTKQLSDVFRKLVIWTLISEVAFWAIAGVLYGSLELSGATFQFLHPGFFWMLLFIPGILVAYLKRWQWKSELYDNYRGMGKTRMLWVTFHPFRAQHSFFPRDCFGSTSHGRSKSKRFQTRARFGHLHGCFILDEYR